MEFPSVGKLEAFTRSGGTHVDVPVDVQGETEGLPEQDATLSWQLCSTEDDA